MMVLWSPDDGLVGRGCQLRSSRGAETAVRTYLGALEAPGAVRSTATAGVCMRASPVPELPSDPEHCTRLRVLLVFCSDLRARTDSPALRAMRVHEEQSSVRASVA